MKIFAFGVISIKLKQLQFSLNVWKTKKKIKRNEKTKMAKKKKKKIE